MYVTTKLGRLVMPLLMLGVLVFASVAIYMYVLNNRDRFITKKASRRPANVIYLPADLDAHKRNKAKGKDS